MDMLSFSQTSITAWNILSNDCVIAGSVNIKKITIDKYRVRRTMHRWTMNGD